MILIPKQTKIIMPPTIGTLPLCNFLELGLSIRLKAKPTVLALDARK